MLWFAQPLSYFLLFTFGYNIEKVEKDTFAKIGRAEGL